MIYVRELIDYYFCQYCDRDEPMPYRIRISGCTNLKEVHDFIIQRNIPAVRYHITHSKVPFDQYREMRDYTDRYYEIRFQNRKDAIQVKLMMRFEY